MSVSFIEFDPYPVTKNHSVKKESNGHVYVPAGAHGNSFFPQYHYNYGNRLQMILCYQGPDTTAPIINHPKNSRQPGCWAFRAMDSPLMTGFGHQPDPSDDTETEPIEKLAITTIDWGADVVGAPRVQGTSTYAFAATYSDLSVSPTITVTVDVLGTGSFIDSNMRNYFNNKFGSGNNGTFAITLPKVVPDPVGSDIAPGTKFKSGLNGKYFYGAVVISSTDEYSPQSADLKVFIEPDTRQF